ncbi:MAG: hypothetical protein FWC85_04160, partial [Elusimicrobia bacterium]|nr:hypothetical protein [Elusimicrobiota bacterium]
GYNIALREYVKERKKCFKTISVKDKYSEIYKKLLWFDDYTIIEQAKKDVMTDSSRWAPYILRHKHLSCFEQLSFMVDEKSGKDAPVIKKEFEQKLKSKGFEEGKDYFVASTKPKHHELTDDTDEENKEENKYYVATKYGKKMKNLLEASPVLKGLKDNHSQIIRYFCEKEKINKFQKIK